MFTAHILSDAEFAALEQIASRLPPSAPIPPEQLRKLIELRYIEAVNGRYEATTAGRFRLAMGS
jgi:hypothetical protein